jgi:co-chaperonin GroES (HSP10)
MTRAASGIVLLQQAHYTDDQGQIHVVGVVANQGQSTQHLIQVSVRFLNSDHLPIAEADRYAYGGALEPGDKTPFEVTLRDPPDGIVDHTLSIRARETDTPAPKGLEVVQFHAEQTGDHTHTVIGELTNHSGLHVTPRLAGVAYGRESTIVDVGITFPQPDPMRPGETVPFSLYELIPSAKVAPQTAIDGRAQLEIVSTYRYVDRWEMLNVVGLVRSTDKVNVATISVIVGFYDVFGALRAVERAYAWHDIVGPGESSPFQVTLYPAREGIDHWAFWPTGHQTEESSPQGLVLTEVKHENQPEGITVISGRVVNQGHEPLTRVRVVAVGYEDDQIRTIGRTAIDGTLGPDAAAAFQFQLPTENATDFGLDVQGRLEN